MSSAFSLIRCFTEEMASQGKRDRDPLRIPWKSLTCGKAGLGIAVVCSCLELDWDLGNIIDALDSSGSRLASAT